MTSDGADTLKPAEGPSAEDIESVKRDRETLEARARGDFEGQGAREAGHTSWCRSNEFPCNCGQNDRRRGDRRIARVALASQAPAGGFHPDPPLVTTESDGVGTGPVEAPTQREEKS